MSALLPPAAPRSSDPVLIAVPPEAVPAVMAVIDAIRSSADGPGADQLFGGRLAVTVPEASRALGLSTGSLRTIIRRGDLHTLAFGRATRISVREFTEYLDRRAGEAAGYAQPMQIGRSARIREVGR